MADGEEWLNNRRVMNRLMLKGTNLDSLLEPSSLVASNLVSRWKQKQEELAGPLDVENLGGQMYRWSLDVIVGTLLGSELYERHAPELDSRLASLAEDIIHVFEDSAKLALLPARLARALHLPTWTRFERNVDRALQGASSLVLDLLPMARGGDGLLERMLESGLELRDIVRIIVDLVLAAGDTTSYAAQWTLYLLARHPEQQNLVSQQVHEDTPTALVRGVIRESMRLYPVAPFITRVLPEDCELGGYNIPAGKLIIMSLYTSGRSALDFPDPERFWPERWLRSEDSADQGSYCGVVNQHATVPFALGARSCIGRKLAETQLMDIVIKMLREFRLELQEPQREVQLVMRLVSVPSEPIRLRLVPR
ncbi:hypothetical protein B566_EDAN003510 [Ephemera danica]|nr:hypothetical protein B566_EDAN003510 [Ephemera danica]